MLLPASGVSSSGDVIGRMPYEHQRPRHTTAAVWPSSLMLQACENFARALRIEVRSERGSKGLGVACDACQLGVQHPTAVLTGDEAAQTQVLAFVLRVAAQR